MPTDHDPEITNLPYVIATNHQEIYRDGRVEPLAPHPPLPAEFAAWLAAARRAGHHRVHGPLLGPDPRTVERPRMDFPREHLNLDEPIWMYPPNPRMWSRAGDRIPMMGNGIDPEIDARRPLSDATLARMRDAIADGVAALLRERHRQLDADHLPDPTRSPDGQLFCDTCGIAVRSDQTHHGLDPR